MRDYENISLSSPLSHLVLRLRLLVGEPQTVREIVGTAVRVQSSENTARIYRGFCHLSFYLVTLAFYLSDG